MTVVVPVVLSLAAATYGLNPPVLPKQLHKLYGDCTMLQHTLKRVDHLGNPSLYATTSSASWWPIGTKPLASAPK